MTTENPLLSEWKTPYGLPPFAVVRAEHFQPAFDVALREHNAEVARIAVDPAAPTFDNTIAAFDASGRLLARIGQLFHNLCSSETSPALQAVERTMAPKLAAHHSAIYLNAALFGRVDALHARRDGLGLTTEARRLLERVHLDFVLAGARLDEAAKRRFAAISERLAELQTTFSQNVLHDESSWALWLDGERDLAGLPAFVRAAAENGMEVALDLVRLGKADVVLAGGYDDLSHVGIIGFADMSATADDSALAARGYEASEMSRPGDRSRAGFVESAGGGSLVVCRGSVAVELGLPVRAVLAMAGSHSDGLQRSIPAKKRLSCKKCHKIFR